MFLDFHRACPGWDHNWQATRQYGRSPPRLSFRFAPRIGRKVWERRSCGLPVAGQLSPRWNKPSGSGMRQEVFRASITEIESRQFAELIFDSSLSVVVLPIAEVSCKMRFQFGDSPILALEQVAVEIDWNEGKNYFASPFIDQPFILIGNLIFSVHPHPVLRHPSAAVWPYAHAVKTSSPSGLLPVVRQMRSSRPTPLPRDGIRQSVP